LPFSVLHIARTEDEFYPLETIGVFDQRLRRSVSDVTMLRLAGKHRFPLQATAQVRAWLGQFSSCGTDVHVRAGPPGPASSSTSAGP
jgi:hypothetical protein